jgi:membrane protease YdiL (CAAX protease family)
VKGSWPIVLFALTWPTIGAAVYFVVLASPVGQAGGPNIWLRAFYASSKLLQFSLPVLWLGLWSRKNWDFQALRPQGLALGLAFGLLVAAAILGLYYGALRGTAYLEHTPAQLRAKLADFGADDPARFVALAAFISLAHSFLEEYYWRWFVYGELRRLVPSAAAMIVSSLAFMGHHVVVLAVFFPGRFFSAALPFSLGIAIGGLFWAWLYERTGSIVTTWVSHFVIDSAIVVVGFDLAFVASH